MSRQKQRLKVGLDEDVTVVVVVVSVLPSISRNGAAHSYIENKLRTKKYESVLNQENV